MRIPTKDIVQGIVNSIDKTFSVKADPATADLIQTKLFICSLKWLRVGDTVLDEEERPVTILQAGQDEIGRYFIVVRKEEAFDWTSKKITSTIIFHFQAGNPNDVNHEWLKKARNSRAKLPLIWLLLPVSDTNNHNGQGIKRVSDLRIFFVEDTEAHYTVDQTYELVIKPLWSIVEGFLDAIKRNPGFAPIENDVSREIYRFGTESLGQFEQNIIDARLAAIELRFSLRIRNGKICDC